MSTPTGAARGAAVVHNNISSSASSTRINMSSGFFLAKKFLRPLSLSLAATSWTTLSYGIDTQHQAHHEAHDHANKHQASRRLRHQGHDDGDDAPEPEETPEPPANATSLMGRRADPPTTSTSTTTTTTTSTTTTTTTTTTEEETMAPEEMMPSTEAPPTAMVQKTGRRMRADTTTMEPEPSTMDPTTTEETSTEGPMSMTSNIGPDGSPSVDAGVDGSKPPSSMMRSEQKKLGKNSTALLLQTDDRHTFLAGSAPATLEEAANGNDVAKAIFNSIASPVVEDDVKTATDTALATLVGQTFDGVEITAEMVAAATPDVVAAAIADAATQDTIKDAIVTAMTEAMKPTTAAPSNSSKNSTENDTAATTAAPAAAEESSSALFGMTDVVRSFIDRDTASKIEFLRKFLILRVIRYIIFIASASAAEVLIFFVVLRCYSYQ
ncbi:unnamed protein product [Amoebophrya sp. A120]|nr:unnamed protein product [Amoebophrya sp. A120]|eukprot:GSA120T00023300001.1